MAEQKMTLEQLDEHIKGVVAPLLKTSETPDAVDVIRERVSEQIKAKGDGVAGAVVDASVAGETAKEPEPESKMDVYVRSMIEGRNDPERAAKILRKWGFESMASSVDKALSSGNPIGGGFLVPDDFATEVIELRRALGVVRSLNPTVVPMPVGSMKFPRINTGATSSYGQENANISASEQRFGQLELAWKKLTSLVPVSNDLVRYSSPAVGTVVRDDMADSMASREDLAFIGGDGTAGSPKGILNLTHGDNKFNADSTNSLATATVDLGKALQNLADANIAMTPQQGASVSAGNGGWIFPPVVWQFFFTLQTGLGTHAFMPEMKNGTLLGFPFRYTTNAGKTALGNSSESVIFGAFRHALIGESMRIAIDASDTAAYHDGSNVVASFSLDQTVVRAISEHDFALRHDKAFSVIETVTWGT